MMDWIRLKRVDIFNLQNVEYGTITISPRDNNEPVDFKADVLGI